MADGTGEQTDRRTDGRRSSKAHLGRGWRVAEPCCGLCSCRAAKAFCCISPPNHPQLPLRSQQENHWHQQICAYSCEGSRGGCCPAAGPTQQSRTLLPQPELCPLPGSRAWAWLESLNSVLEMDEEPLNVSKRVPAPLWGYHTQLCHVLGFFPMGSHSETHGEDCVMVEIRHANPLPTNPKHSPQLLHLLPDVNQSHEHSPTL